MAWSMYVWQTHPKGEDLRAPLVGMRLPAARGTQTPTIDDTGRRTMLALQGARRSSPFGWFSIHPWTSHRFVDLCRKGAIDRPTAHLHPDRRPGRAQIGPQLLWLALAAGPQTRGRLPAHLVPPIVAAASAANGYQSIN